MEQLNLTQTRRSLPQIINEKKFVEVSNRTSSSVILPKSHWETLQQQMKEMEKELIQREMDAVLLRKEKSLTHEEVEKEIMEILNDNLGT